MTVTCPKCSHRYEFATMRLGGKDRPATCGRCGHKFLVRLLKKQNVPVGLLAVSDHGTQVAAPTPAGLPAPHVRVSLTVLDGPRKDETFRLGAAVTVVGRTTGDLALPDPQVSSRHAQVEFRDGEAWLRDLGSTNGTFVNDRRVELVKLSHMDVVTVGATHLLFTYIEDLASAYDACDPNAPQE